MLHIKKIRDEERSGIPTKLNPIITRSVTALGSDDHQNSPCVNDSSSSPNCTWDNGLRFRRGKIANWFSSYFSPKSCEKPNPNLATRSPTKVNKPPTASKAQKIDLHKHSSKGKQETQIPYIPSPLKSFSCELGPKTGIQKSPIKSRSFTDMTELFTSLNSQFSNTKLKINNELLKVTKDLKLAVKNGLLTEVDYYSQELTTILENIINMSPSTFRDTCEKIVRDLSERRGKEELKSLLLEKFKTRVLFILTRCTRLLQFGEDNLNANGESFEKFKKCLESIPSIDTTWTHSKEGSACSTESTKQQSLPNKINKWDPQETELCRICEQNIPSTNLDAHSYVCAYANECEEGGDVDERLIKIADMLEQIAEAYGLDFEGSVDSSTRSDFDSPQFRDWPTRGMEEMFEDIHELDTARIIEESYFCASNSVKSPLAMKLFDSVNGSSCTSPSSINTPRGNSFDLFWVGHNNPSDLENITLVTRMAYVTRKVANVDCERETAQKYLLSNLRDLIEILQQNQMKGLVIDTFGTRIKKLLKKKYLRVTEHTKKRDYEKDNENKEKSSELSSSLEDYKQQVQMSISNENERISIDDFEQIKEISRGAFGKVFLAKKRTTGDLFAIKVLKKIDMLRKNDIERILAERDILIAVRNPFVVRFFYSFTCRENLYLVMEYLNGGDLYSLLKGVGCLDEKNARMYIAELVLALEYLHSLGIIHRDLKPDNILIAGNGHIKLTDFGLSKIGLIANSLNLSETNSSPNRSDESNSGSSSSKRTKSGSSAVGTPDYLAPEILLGTEHGCAADWWSVGVILFELLTGMPPFAARSPEMIFDNILNRRIHWPDVPTEISYEAKDLIDRLLTHDEFMRLGVNGASEVKAHRFFADVNWDNTVSEEAAFVPCPENTDDTSYFMSRYPQNNSSQNSNLISNSNSNNLNSNSTSNHEITTTSTTSSISIPIANRKDGLVSGWGEEDTGSESYVDISSINFSFKNLAQLATMNYDVLRNGKTK